MICRARFAVLPVLQKSLRHAQPVLSSLLRESTRGARCRHRCLHDTNRRSSATGWMRRKDVLPAADTIYAVSTPPGRGAIAIIRISGPACLDIYGGLCPNRPFPHPRTATLRKLFDPCSSSSAEPQVLDSGALLLYFPAPNTVTGEDLLELHVHGGPAIVRSVLEAIPACTKSRDRRRPAEYSHIRPAEAGEFTKRAFYNGRLDLTQVEALGDVLAAETEQQRRLATTGTESGLAKRYEEWRNMLLYARGELEALIDFSEDQHFEESPAEFVSSITTQVTALKRQISLHLQNASRGELLRNGISIALLGAPNAGKSSLLNRIVGREAAIVSAEEGTTRDIVDVSVDIGGWLCRLGDMAGLRAKNKSGRLRGRTGSIGAVEEEGIRRARARALGSDLVIVLLPLQSPPDGNFRALTIDEEVISAVRECEKAGKEMVYAVNKIDLVISDTGHWWNHEILPEFQRAFPNAGSKRLFAISCKDVETPSAQIHTQDPGKIQKFLEGLAAVFSEMTNALADLAPNSATFSPAQAQSYWHASLSISHRQTTYLRQCLIHLDEFLDQAGASASPHPSPSHHLDNHHDLVSKMHGPDRNGAVDIVALAEVLRDAAECLARITGRGDGGDVEDVLGVVFEKFCVGK